MRYYIAACAVAIVTLSPNNALAMHITEGILPASWAALWIVLAIPFVAMGIWELNKKSASLQSFKPMVALVGSAIFIISCMPIPVPIAGTTAHPCGVGLGAILLGPALTALISSVTLMLQALFLAHGGVTTIGANVLSMGVLGAFSGYAAYKLALRFGASWQVGAFLAGVVSDWATYFGTSLFLALGLAQEGEFTTMLLGIMAAFVPTQLPLGLLEGFVTMKAYGFILHRRPTLLAMAPQGRPE